MNHASMSTYRALCAAQGLTRAVIAVTNGVINPITIKAIKDDEYTLTAQDEFDTSGDPTQVALDLTMAPDCLQVPDFTSEDDPETLLTAAGFVGHYRWAVMRKNTDGTTEVINSFNSRALARRYIADLSGELGPLTVRDLQANPL